MRCLIACHTASNKNAPESERQHRNPGQQLPFVARDACETIGDDGEGRRRDQERHEIDEKANDDQLRPPLLRFRRLRARAPIQLSLRVEWRRNRKVNEQQTARQYLVFSAHRRYGGEIVGGMLRVGPATRD